MAYQLVASPTSLNNPQDHAPNAAFKMRFLARLCTAVDDISTDTARCTVPSLLVLNVCQYLWLLAYYNARTSAILHVVSLSN